MIRVIGVAEALAMFGRAGVVGTAIEAQGVDATAQAIAADARARAPVATGFLRDSIEVTEEGVEVMADYGLFVEYGTSDTVAQPFIRPAADTIEG